MCYNPAGKTVWAYRSSEDEKRRPNATSPKTTGLTQAIRQVGRISQSVHRTGRIRKSVLRGPTRWLCQTATPRPVAPQSRSLAIQGAISGNQWLSVFRAAVIIESLQLVHRTQLPQSMAAVQHPHADWCEVTTFKTDVKPLTHKQLSCVRFDVKKRPMTHAVRDAWLHVRSSGFSRLTRAVFGNSTTG